MRKSKTLLSTMIVIAIIGLLSSCIPNGGGSVNPNNGTFKVNLVSRSSINGDNFDSKYQTLFIDGDSIRFGCQTAAGCLVLCSGVSYFSIGVTNNSYDILTVNDTTVLINKNITISNNLPSGYSWKHIMANGTESAEGNNVVGQSKYLVFRKLKPSGEYMYFWVRTVTTAVALSSSISPIQEAQMLNGKNQINSIVSGV